MKSVARISVSRHYCVLSGFIPEIQPEIIQYEWTSLAPNNTIVTIINFSHTQTPHLNIIRILVGRIHVKAFLDAGPIEMKVYLE
jgi:hypothetical protein